LSASTAELTVPCAVIITQAASVSAMSSRSRSVPTPSGSRMSSMAMSGEEAVIAARASAREPAATTL
jgi:hypothetical protein